MTTGIHHITLITRKVQANVDFYTGFLGLRLIKRTGGFEDATQLHLFYGDAVGSPGSLVTFLVWEDGSPGRIGHGQVSEIALAIDPQSIGFWLTRALQFGIKAEGPMQEFGQPVLRLKDPDGIIVKLVGTSLKSENPWISPQIEEQNAVQRLQGATVLTEQPEETATFVKDYFGFTDLSQEGTIQRLVSKSGDCLDIRDATGFWPGIPGTGVADHVAFRARDKAQVLDVNTKLEKLNFTTTNVHDRKYFYSLYVREPAGTLFEFASDDPGFLIDETYEELGSHLFVPPHDRDREQDFKLMMPQFSLNDEPRIRYRDLDFVHRFYVPENPNGRTIVHLHGTGGTEFDLMPLAHRLDENATLLGVRGRSNEEGIQRWFRRFTAMSYDQDDIKFEAAAFASFMEDAIKAYDLDPNKIVFLGFSNGANLLGAEMLLHPETVRKAILLRSTMPLEQVDDVDLTGIEVLNNSGVSDPFRAGSKILTKALRDKGANVEENIMQAGHDLSPQDLENAKAWLSEHA